MVGKTISHYRVLDKIGEGGMGVVYKAEDTRLDRTVALKFLSSRLIANDEARGRFFREAKAAAALDHPNICTIYEIDEAEGRVFLAMAYVEGETLAHKIQRCPLPLEEALSTAIQVADGLSVAHARDVVHGDITSANIMVAAGARESASIKILDFGLAQLKGRPEIFRAGVIAGTPAYMSPEQLLGEAIDHRTDIWSLGVLLYEMVAGRLPFNGALEAALSYGILSEEPEPLTGLRTGVAKELERVVQKALAKNREERYQHIDEMQVDLISARKAQHRRLTGAAGPLPQKLPSVAVMPFLNMNGDKESEFFSDGITEDIINALMKVDGLQVAARSSVFQFKGKNPGVRQVGEALRVSAVLEGSLRSSGKRLRLTAELIDSADGYQMWSERYDRIMEDIFEIQDEISQAIVEKLKVRLAAGPSQRFARRHTENVDAYNLYLKGLFHWNKQLPGAIFKAVDYYEQALVEDPDYALAYAGLATCYGTLAYYASLPPRHAVPKSRDAALRALALDGTLADAHAWVPYATATYDYDWRKAEREFQHALALNPGDARTRFWYSLFVLAATGRLEEALSEALRAQELDPVNPVTAAGPGQILYFQRQYDKAAEDLRKALELDPASPPANVALGKCYLQIGDYQRALDAFERVKVPYFGPAHLGIALQSAGQTEEARELLNELRQISRKGYRGSFWIALICQALGDTAEALEYLEAACEERAPTLYCLKVDPYFDPLRSESQFQSLLSKIGLGK